MHRKELIQDVANLTKTPTFQVEDIVDAVFKAIKKALLEGDKVTVLNFATFEIKTAKERKAVNPSTNEHITVPAKKYIKTKFSLGLRKKINKQ